MFENEFVTIDRKFTKKELVAIIYKLEQRSFNENEFVTVDDLIELLEDVKSFDEVDSYIKENI